MNAAKRERPGLASEALEVQAAARTEISVSPASVIDGTHAVLVITGNETRRRRLYLGLDSAERAVRRARNAGIAATLVLCEIRPLGGAGC